MRCYLIGCIRAEGKKPSSGTTMDVEHRDCTGVTAYYLSLHIRAAWVITLLESTPEL